MLQRHNQRFPFHFDGAADDPMFYAELKKLTTSSAKPGAEAKARDYFHPRIAGGWRGLTAPG